MNYLKLPNMDSEVSVMDICQAHAQLESDYNVGGIVRERPSNERRNASTGVQLSRMGYLDMQRHVQIVPEKGEENRSDNSDDENVRDIYLINVLKWNLPMDKEMKEFVAERYTPEFLEGFASWNSNSAKTTKAARP